MIVYQDLRHDPVVEHARLASLEALAEAHKLHCYSNVEALEAFLDQGLTEMTDAGVNPGGLTRIVLVYTDPRAVAAVATRMAPGHDFAAWPQPDAWLALYARIDDLRERARSHNPQFVPRHI
jgi:hypothetical protein